MSTDCPTSVELKNFATGRIAEDAFETISLHVDRCATCRATVEDLEKHENTLLDALRGMGDSPLTPAGSALLKALDRAQSFAPSNAISPQSPRPEPPRCDETIPAAVRDYELLGLLGRGGMGEVYRARHRRLGRIVAVKLMARHRLGRDAAIRFQREMRAAGRLDHPNIVRAFDAGEENGVPYLVMELVAGTNASALVRQRGPLSVADACEVVRQASLGLQHACESGLVHRDVKPSNLMLTGDGHVKIVDFGLARIVKHSAEEQELTAAQHVLGTIDFIAPEQCESSSDVDIRADLYSLGCTLYFLLAGQPPFGTPRYDSPFKKMKAHAEAEPPSLAGQRTDVPAKVVAVVERLLQKKPEERFDTPQLVAEALAPFCAGANLSALLGEQVDEPASGQTRSGSEPVTEASGRSRIRTTLLALFVVLIVTLGLTVPKLWRSRPRRTAAENSGPETPARGSFDAAFVSQPLSPVALVNRPADLGARIVSWTIETIAHRGRVDGLAFSPDSAQLASGGKDGTVRIWNVADRQLAAALVAHPASVTCLDWSTDGTKLATGSHDGTVITWDTRTWQPSGRFHGDGELTALAWSPDGQQLATNNYMVVQAWTPGAKGRPASFDGPEKSVSDLVWLDGDRLAASSFDGRIYTWDTADGSLDRTWQDHEGRVWAMSLAPDRRWLASASWDDTVRVWDLATGESNVFAGHTGDVWDVAWSPDGRRFVSAGWDGDVRVWDVATRESNRVWSDHTGRVTRAAWSPDGRIIATADEFGELRFWNGESFEPAGVVAGHDVIVQSLRWSDDGSRLRVTGRDGVPRDWDIDTGKATALPACPGGKGFWSAHGTRFARTSKGRLIRLGNSKGQDTGEVLTGHDATVLDMSWSPAAKHLASVARDRTIRVWDVETQTCIKVLDQHEAAVNCVAWAPHADFFVTGGDDATFVWNAATFEKAATLDAVGYGAAWSPDLRMLAVAENWAGMRVGLWSTRSWTLLAEYSDSTRLDEVAWSPDSRRVAAGNVNGQVHLLDATTGQRITTLRDHAGAISALAWSNRDRLAAASSDGVVRVLDGPTGRILATLLVLSGGQHLVVDSSGGIVMSPLAEPQLVGVTQQADGRHLLPVAEVLRQRGRAGR